MMCKQAVLCVSEPSTCCVSETVSANRCGGGGGGGGGLTLTHSPLSLCIYLLLHAIDALPEPPSLPWGHSQRMSALRGGGDGNHADSSSDQFHGCDNEDSEGHNRSQSFMDVIDGWSPRSPCVLCIMHSAPRLPSFLAAIQNQKVSRPKPTYWAKVVVR